MDRGVLTGVDHREVTQIERRKKMSSAQETKKVMKTHLKKLNIS